MIPKPQTPPATIGWWRDDCSRIKRAIRLEQPLRHDDKYGNDESGEGRRDRPLDESDYNTNIRLFRTM